MIKADSDNIKRSLFINNIGKTYHTHSGDVVALKDISFGLEMGEKIAVLGRNGAGKSTLVRIISGCELPTSGYIGGDLFLSWPLGFAGGLVGNMTGKDNIRFISRLYDKPFKETLELVDDFAELGKHLNNAVKNYSSGMRMRLAFGLTLAVDFDCLLIDEVLSVGDARFHRKCHEELFVKRSHLSMILISHDLNIIREFCKSALVLKNGFGRVFDDLELAISIYNTL